LGFLLAKRLLGCGQQVLYELPQMCCQLSSILLQAVKVFCFLVEASLIRFAGMSGGLIHRT